MGGGDEENDDVDITRAW